MNKLRRIAILIAIFVLSVCFMAGCGKNKNTNTIDKNTIYKEEPLAINLPNGFQTNVVNISKDKLYITGYLYDDVTYESKSQFGSVNLDGSNLKLVDCDNNSWIERMFVAEDGSFYTLYSTYYEDASDPDNYIYENSYWVSKYTKDCEPLASLNLTEEFDISWVSTALLLGNDLLLSSDSKVYVLDDNLKLKSKKEVDEDIYYDLIKLKDGSYATMKWDENGQKLVRFDINTLKTGDEIPFPVSLYNYGILTSGDAPYDIMLRDSTQVYGFNFGDTALTPIFNFINSDVNTSYFQNFSFVDDKTFIGTYYDWSDDGYNFKVCKYTKVNPEDVKDKKLISVGCLYINGDLRKRIIDFNKSNDEYRIVATDYSVYSTEDDWEAGMNKFNQDIASGQAPDIIAVSDFGKLENYMSKGLFLDLGKYIDSDPEINKEDIFPNLLELSSYNGKMYTVIPQFAVRTLSIKSKFLNGKTTWTLDEMKAFENSLKQDQKLFQYNTRYNFTYNFFAANAGTFVDSVNGKCYFDSPEFISFLEYLKTLPESGDDYGVYYDEGFEGAYNSDDAYRTDKILANETYINSLSEYKYLLHGVFAEPITMIGFPVSKGNGSVMVFDQAYAVSAKSANPEACWNFIKYYLSKDYQDTITYEIPASMRRFDELGKLAQERPFYMDGNEKIEYDDEYYVNGEWIPIAPLTQAEVDEVKEFIKSVDKVYGNLGELETIIDEEAAAFFEGQKTAEDVVKIIQSRATIYINERQ